MIFLGLFFFFAGIKDPQIPSLPGTRRGSSAASFPLKSLGREKALPVRPSLNRCFHARESESRGKIQWMFPDQSHPFFSRSLSSVSSWSASSPLGRLMWLLKGSFGKQFQKITLQGAIPPFVPGFIGNSGLGSAVAWARGAGQGFAEPQRGFFLSFRVEKLLQNPV